MATGTSRSADRQILGAVGGIDGQGTDSETDESLLRLAVVCMRPFLAHLGLWPTRVVAYLRQRSAHLQRFPAHERLKEIQRMEDREDDGMQLAVSSFTTELLSEHAPPGILSHFLLALFDANNDEGHPNAGAWRVHDVLILTCAYMPLQRSILLRQNDIDLSAVVKSLMTHRLLTPENMSHVTETLELDGEEAGIVRMLSFVYSKLANTIESEYSQLQAQSEGQDHRRFQQIVRRNYEWLTTLLRVLDHHSDGAHCIRDDVPPEMLSPETWNDVCDRLSFRRQHDQEPAMGDIVSEAGDSVAGSDLTHVEHSEASGNTRSLNAATTPEQGVQLPSNSVRDARLQRTQNFIQNTRGAQEQMPYIVEFITYERKRMDREDRAKVKGAFPAVRLGDSSSGSGTASVSTEDNTTFRQNDDMETRELARALYYTGLSDGPDHGPKPITLYDYQNELLHSVREWKNSVIVLPTGTGKTFIVLKYTQEVLSKPGTQRVVFMAPKVKLAEQQYRRFQLCFPKMTYFRVGRSSNTNCYAPFAELLDLYRVFVMTPQCLVEAVKRGEVSITDFSLLVLDECHHAMGGHSYKVLMDLYMDAKFSQGTSAASLPQIVGLTASPGVGRGGTLDIAMDHLKQLCYNMNVEAICTVKKHTEQLTRFVNEPKHEIRTCMKRKKDEFKRIIESIMKTVEDRLVRSSYDGNSFDKETRELVDVILKAPELHRGLMRYSEWASNVNSHLAQIDTYNKEAYTAAFSITEMLLRYQGALILNEDCESQYALDYLMEQARITEEQGTGVSETERKLLEQFQAKVPDLQKACADTDDYNPKLKMLEDILLQMWDKNQDDAAGMVFVRTLELSKAVQKWIEVHPDLKNLAPGRITGSRKSNKRPGGMTKNEVADVLTDFNSGKHKVVVCTSAAEEGLDFQSCNVVVRYDYVTHMISMIQTRGRARQKDSEYWVLGNQLKGNLDKEMENLACERLMKEAVAKVQAEMESNTNSFLYEMDRRQRLDLAQRQREAEEKQRKRRAAQDTGEVQKYNLKCRKCNTYACASTDFRLLGDSSRIVVAEDFHQRWNRLNLKCGPEQYTHTLVKIAKVHCKKCSLDWGCVTKYIPSGQEFPVLKLQNFHLHDLQTGKLIPRKFKWADNMFHVDSITEDELCMP